MTQQPDTQDDGRSGRGRPRREKRRVPLLGLGLLVLAALLVANAMPRLGLPSLSNPFRTETVDRSGPVLLTSLTDLARFQAASGTFQVIVDVDKDVKRVPSLLAGERTLFLALGTVDAYVDFTGLGEDAVRVSADSERVDVVLPPAALSDPRVDPEQSRIYSRDRGVFNRLGGIFSDSPTSEQELYVTAQDKIGEAATVGGLQQRAEDNTRAMLTGLLATLGYTDVHVEFTPDGRP